MIPDIFAQGGRLHGFSDDRWTTARLAAVIESRFGIRYDHDHVGRLMHKLGLRSTPRGSAPLAAPAQFPAPAAVPAFAHVAQTA
jgi:transposase